MSQEAYGTGKWKDPRSKGQTLPSRIGGCRERTCAPQQLINRNEPILQRSKLALRPHVNRNMDTLLPACNEKLGLFTRHQLTEIGINPLGKHSSNAF